MVARAVRTQWRLLDELPDVRVRGCYIVHSQQELLEKDIKEFRQEKKDWYAGRMEVQMRPWVRVMSNGRACCAICSKHWRLLKDGRQRAR